MTTVQCTASIRDDEQLKADADLSEWIANLPVGTALSPITVDKGSQRDPWPVLVGLTATWEESR